MIRLELDLKVISIFVQVKKKLVFMRDQTKPQNIKLKACLVKTVVARQLLELGLTLTTCIQEHFKCLIEDQR